MYHTIAKKLLDEELERIKLKPKYYCGLYDWKKLNEHAHKFVPKLVVRESAINTLAEAIMNDHIKNNKWEDLNDKSVCVYSNHMIAEYFEEITKDFNYQMKSYTVGIPLFDF